jgi:hypothetical protein
MKMLQLRYLVIAAGLITLIAAVAIFSPSRELLLGTSDEKLPKIERTAHASVVITPPRVGPPIDRVQMSPQDASLSAGRRFVFTAVALDAQGKPVVDADFQWQVKDASVGTITSTGLFTAGVRPGMYMDVVEVSVITGSGPITANANVEVVSDLEAQTRLLDFVVAYPSNITVRPGQVVGLGALGWDERSRLVQGLRFTWGMTNAAAGSVDQFGFFTASQVSGRYPDSIQVTATQDTPQGKIEIRSFISVKVTDVINRGVLSQVVVVPGSVRLTPDQRFGLSARAFDETGQPVRDVSFAWEVTQPAAGSMEKPGYFVAGHETGRYPDAIQAVATQLTPKGPVQATATVTVTVEPPRVVGDLALVQLVPSEVVLKPGQRFVFTAFGLDSGGNMVPGRGEWEVAVESSAGSIGPTGVFKAGSEPGTYKDAVKVVFLQEKDGQRLVVEALATVNILGPLERVEIRSPTVSLEAGQSLRVFAVGYDASGFEIPALGLRWSVEVPLAGSINRSGFFTAGADPGSYENAIRVIAVELDTG